MSAMSLIFYTVGPLQKTTRNAVMGARVGTCPPPEKKCKFASITTFWFTQTEPPDTFYELKIHINAFAAGTLPQSPLRELTALLQTS